MTDTPRDRTFTNYALIPDAQGRLVFVVPEAEGWSLPHWEERATQSWGAAADVNRTMGTLLGLEVTMLRTLPHDPSASHVVRILEMENQSPGREPSLNGRWLGVRDLASLHLTVPEHRAVLAGWLAAQARGAMRAGAPWTRPGWFRSAATWMESQASSLGRRPAGPVVQERSWSISCVLRLPTLRGDLYLKASGGPFAHEPIITHDVARRFPGHVPEVLALEASSAWMLMEDMGGERLQRIKAIEPWEEAARLIARMQLESVGRVDEMLASEFSPTLNKRIGGNGSMNFPTSFAGCCPLPKAPLL